MGQTYLVLLLARGPVAPYCSALVLYEGTDDAAAQAAYEEGVRVHRGQGNAAIPPGRVVMTTRREETNL